MVLEGWIMPSGLTAGIDPGLGSLKTILGTTPMEIILFASTRYYNGRKEHWPRPYCIPSCFLWDCN